MAWRFNRYVCLTLSVGQSIYLSASICLYLYMSNCPTVFILHQTPPSPHHLIISSSPHHHLSPTPPLNYLVLWAVVPLLHIETALGQQGTDVGRDILHLSLLHTCHAVTHTHTDRQRAIRRQTADTQSERKIHTETVITNKTSQTPRQADKQQDSLQLYLPMLQTKQNKTVTTPPSSPLTYQQTHLL